MKQPRDKMGRFLSWDGTRNRKFTKDEMKESFLAGLRCQSTIYSPSKSFEFFMRKYEL